MGKPQKDPRARNEGREENPALGKELRHVNELSQRKL